MKKENATPGEWTNAKIAELLRRVAAAYVILGENRFRIAAYEGAATAVEHASSEAKDLWDDGKLRELPAVGPTIASHLDELFRTGRSRHFASVLGKINPAVFPLLNIPGLGPKKADKLVKSLSLRFRDEEQVVADLERAAREHRIASLEGFGERSEADVLEGIARWRRGAVKEKRLSLPQADRLAEEIIAYLYAAGAVEKSRGERVDKLGSLRRRTATVGDIDLAVATRRPEETIAAFVRYPRATGLVEKGSTGATILVTGGRQVDLRVADPAEYGAMVQYFTGSKQHNIALREMAREEGWSLSEYGIKSLKTLKTLKFAEEKKFYEFLGREYIPPELREDAGELEVKRLPSLVELQDIRGDLHVHSNLLPETSHDAGENTIGEIRKIGGDRGYEYIGVSDHNPKMGKERNEETVKILRGRKADIEHENSSCEKEAEGNKSVRVINLLEIDILPDGKLAIPEEGWDYLDAGIIAIHSVFNMSREAMTKRVLAGLAHPAARILAHPTGRLLEKREGYELDWEEVFAFCREHDKALEINAYPDRLDLPDVLVREAIRRGIKLSLGTDAHCRADLAMMPYGVSVARRGWAEAKDVINCWDYEKILAWLRKRS